MDDCRIKKMKTKEQVPRNNSNSKNQGIFWMKRTQSEFNVWIIFKWPQENIKAPQRGWKDQIFKKWCSRAKLE